MDDTARLAAIDATFSQYIRLLSEVGGNPAMASILHMGLMPLIMQAGQDVENRMDNDVLPEPAAANGGANEDAAWWDGQGAHALQLVTGYIAGKLQTHTVALHQAMGELDGAEAELANEAAAMQAQFHAVAGGVLQHLHVDDDDDDDDSDDDGDEFGADEDVIPPVGAVANPNPLQAPQAGPSTTATTTPQASATAEQSRRSSTGSAYLDTALARSPAEFRREFWYVPVGCTSSRVHRYQCHSNYLNACSRKIKIQNPPPN
jgi:hypothetical protein